MKTYTKPILMAVAMLSMIGCDKSDADGRFSDNPRSEIGTPQEGSLVTAKQVKLIILTIGLMPVKENRLISHKLQWKAIHKLKMVK